jgi:hypothetical protein
MEAASVPLYVAMQAGSITRNAMIEFLIKSGGEGDLASIHSSKLLLNDTSPFDGLIPTFQTLHEHGILSQHFGTLYKTLAIQFYGCVEDLSKQLLKAVLTKDIQLLNQLDSKGLKIGKSDCSKLKRRIDQERNENNMSLEQAYDETVFNKGYSFEQYNEIFLELVGFNFGMQQENCLKRLESSRHLFVHKNSIIDQKFLLETQSSALRGTILNVTAEMMYEWESAVISHACNLLKACDQYCS